jgi:hypothetical protein
MTSTSAASQNGVVSETSVRSHAAPRSGSTKAEVLAVFRALKVNLVARISGSSAQPVTVLSAVVRSKPRPWSVQIFLYPSSVMALQAFDAGIGGWHNNGIPVARANNLIVTVVPNGREIGATAPPFPMPKLVRDALRALARMPT